MPEGPAAQEPVTFLFTDVEGSTKLWEQNSDAMGRALAEHDDVLRHQIAQSGGTVFSTAGDAFAAAFDDPDAAVAAAMGAQRALNAREWPEGAEIRVRMGVHTGGAQRRDDNFFGPTLNRAARLMSAAHGGQVVLSGATRSLVTDLPLRDLGEHRLKDLSEPERVWQLAVQGLSHDFPPLRTLTATPTNLPVSVSSFIGRDDDITGAMHALENQRLVTLTGVGGVGKTRLSLQVAADASHHYPDGLWFVELAPVRVGDAVPYRFIETLGLDPQPGQPPLHTVAQAVGDGTVLMVVDNCEHVLGEAANAIGELLTNCPNLRVLASSRRSLGIDGEQRRPIAPLDTEGSASPSVQLFVERAAAANPELDLTGRFVVIEDICTRLDGVPLAIELAAARTRSMTPEDVANRLGERFRLLVAPKNSTDQRKRTLLSMLEWSHELLDERQRRLFDRLGVFAGSFTLEAANQVCTDGVLDELDVADLIDELVDQSLVISDTSGIQARYRLLQTIREFSIRQLGDDLDQLRDRHADWHARWADRVGQRSRTSDEMAAVTELEEGWSDLRAAVSHCVDDAGRSATILGSLLMEAQWRGRLEFGDWADAALAAAGGLGIDAEVHVVLQACAAGMAGMRGDIETTRTLGTAVAEACEGGTPIPLTVAPALISAVMVAADTVLAARLVEVADANTSIADEAWVPALLATTRAFVATYADRPDDARDAVATALRSVPENYSPSMHASTQWMAARNSDAPPSEVIAQLEAAVEVATEARSSLILALLTQLLLAHRSLMGDVAGPMRETADNLQGLVETRTMGPARHLVSHAALMLNQAGCEQDAVTLLGWLALDEVFQAQLPTLDAETTARAKPFVQAGAAMSDQDAVQFAIARLLAAADASEA